MATLSPTTSPTAGRLLDLQRSAGNRAVAGLVASVQREPRVPIASGGGSSGGRVPIASGGSGGERGTPVDKVGLIDNDLKAGGGVNLRTVPSTEGNEPIARLPHNQQVTIHTKHPGNWFRVVATTGADGFVTGDHLRTEDEMPDPGSKLHRIAPNETAFDIVHRAYGVDAMQAGTDARFYSNVLVYANEDRQRHGIRKPSDAEKTQLIKAMGIGKYLDAWTVAGAQIWVPSKEWADAMKGKVSAGSFARDTWEKAKEWGNKALEFVTKVPAFVGGLIVGVGESLVDLVKGLFDLVKSIVTGSIVSDIKALIELVSNPDARKEVLHALGDQLAAKWDHPTPYKKWYWRGWLIGYVIGEVLGAILTAGAGAALAGSKYGAKFASFVKALKPVQYAMRTAAKVKATTPLVKAGQLMAKVTETASAGKGMFAKLIDKITNPFKKKAGSAVSGPNAAKAAAKVKELQATITKMAAKYGFPAERLAKFVEVAVARDVRIWLRKGNQASLRHLQAGAVPKPGPIKAKTIKQADLYLYKGLKKDDLGLVGFFQPSKPMRPPGISTEAWKKLRKRLKLDARYRERMAEFNSQSELMSVLEKKWNDPARLGYKETFDSDLQVTVSNGRVQVIDAEAGTVRNVAGDIDVLQMTKADGSGLDGRVGGQLDDALLELDLTEHGPHLWWKPSKASDFDIDLGVLEGHKSGGLLEVSPDGLREVGGSSVPGFAERLAAARRR